MSLILSCSLLARSCCCSCSTLVKRSVEKKQKANRSDLGRREITADNKTTYVHPYFGLPKSPLSRASASGGFRSFRSESSCGFDKSICWSKAGSSRPWEVEPRKAVGVEGCGARGCDCCRGGAGCCGRMAPRWLVEVPGTVMERKSIWGRPEEHKGQMEKGS